MNYPITAVRMLHDHVRQALRVYLDTHVWKGRNVKGEQFERIVVDVFSMLFSEKPPHIQYGDDDEDIYLGAYFEDVVITGHDMTPLSQLEE